jgi:KipI family sensor histidine kinase inhibitor
VQVLPVGRDAVLVEVDTTAAALSLADWCRERRIARDVVPGARTVLLDGLHEAGLHEPGLHEPGLHEPGRLDELLAGWSPVASEPGPLVHVPMTYDGPDLEDVAERWGCTPEDVAARHGEVELVSAFCGFAPGFAYLSGLTVGVPRLATPRTRVPAGSVAVAGTWCGVYPQASRGGWRVIGRTDVALWDVSRPEPALLAPGTRVRFVVA